MSLTCDLCGRPVELYKSDKKMESYHATPDDYILCKKIWIEQNGARSWWRWVEYWNLKECPDFPYTTRQMVVHRND